MIPWLERWFRTHLFIASSLDWGNGYLLVSHFSSIIHMKQDSDYYLKIFNYFLLPQINYKLLSLELKDHGTILVFWFYFNRLPNKIVF